MKKNIFTYLLISLGIWTLSSCTEEVGTEPGNDSVPSAIVYQYSITAADGDYDADTDVRIRIAANSAASEVYYLAESTASKESAVANSGIESYRQRVVEQGTKVTLTDGVADVILTGLLNANTITVVAKAANGTLTSQETSFFGIHWVDICKGEVKAPLFDGSNKFTWGAGEFTLQQREDKPLSYRVKDVFRKGYHVFIEKESEVLSEGADDFFGLTDLKFSYAMMTKTATPYSLGDYGTISFAGLPDYGYYCRMYENNLVAIYAQLSVSAGTWGNPDFFYFSPSK